jgi:serine/threonine protein kinase
MVGRSLGHYEILEPLGAGGMGAVYLAEDTTLKRKVALKVLFVRLRVAANLRTRGQEELLRPPPPVLT